MATIIYRKDESGEIVKERCEASVLQGKLAQGYAVDPGDLETKKEEEAVEKVDPWEGYTVKEIRQLAKEAKIEKYGTSRIETLKAALDAQE